VNILELFLISIALSVDCFIISVFITSLTKVKWYKYISIPLHFAIFHILMLFTGYKIGIFFKSMIEGFDHWIAFILLTGVGVRILFESFNRKGNKLPSLSTEWKIIVFSFATSIDALIIGLTFSFTSVALYPSSLILGFTVLIISVTGLLIGRKLNGFKFKYLDIVAGIVLIGLGLKILINHLM